MEGTLLWDMNNSGGTLLWDMNNSGGTILSDMNNSERGGGGPGITMGT